MAKSTRANLWHEYSEWIASNKMLYYKLVIQSPRGGINNNDNKTTKYFL